jgi:uncharacterized protein YecT (DUF1311 family)
MKSESFPLRLILLLVGVVASLPAVADEPFDVCLKSVGMADSRCGKEWVGRAQARLDAAWLQLLDLAGDAGFAKALSDEQHAWKAFHGLSCSFKLDEGFGGADGPTGYHACRAEVIADRAAALEAYIKYIDN